MTKYAVHLNTTFGVIVEVDAESKAQAELIAENLVREPSYLETNNTYHHVATNILNTQRT